MNVSLLYWVDLFGTSVFALSGVLVAARMKMDPFGALVLAGVTAIGGGTCRDIMLGATPVFWIKDATYLWVILGTWLAAMALLRVLTYLPQHLLAFCDAIGLAAFVGIGVEKAILFQQAGVIAILMGVLTGCGGGIIRDTLVRTIPMVFRKEVYATTCIIGGLVHVICLSQGMVHSTALLIGAVTTLVLRLCAIRGQWRLPALAIQKSK